MAYTAWIYVDTSKQIGDKDHLKVFASEDAANRWFSEHDPEGVAFEYPVDLCLRPGPCCSGDRLNQSGLQVRRWLVSVLLLFAIYVPFAIWATWFQVKRGSGWEPPAPKGQTVVRLMRPFEPSGGAVIVRGLPYTLGPGDRDERDVHSQVVLYEDTKPLGPAHSSIAAIVKLGRGRFLHWEAKAGGPNALIFSASDNSDPNSNGRHYWAVLP